MGKQSLCTVKPPYVTPKVAATLVGFNVNTIMSWVRKGAIPSYFEADPKSSSDGRRGWVRPRDLTINPETGKPRDSVSGKPVYVDINEVRKLISDRARALKGLPA